MAETQDEDWNDKLDVYRVDSEHNVKPPGEHTYISPEILKFIESQNIVSLICSFRQTEN